MVLHFRHLEQHKKAVLSLYRTLLRHITHLNQSQLELNQSEQIQLSFQLKFHVKEFFKLHRGSLSGKSARSQLQYGLEFEERLRSLYTDSSNYQYIKDAIRNRELLMFNKTEKPEETKPTLQKLGYNKLNEENIEKNKHSQIIDSYTTHYIRKQQREKLIPQGLLDKKYVGTVLRDEAIYDKNSKTIKRESEIIYSKGPPIARIISANAGVEDIHFLRLPWGQSKYASPLILRNLRESQAVFDMENILKSYYYVYGDMEDEWENQLNKQFPKLQENNDTRNSSSWNSEYKSYLSNEFAKMKKTSSSFKSYIPKLERQKKEFQEILNKNYIEKEKRFQNLINELEGKDIGPHTDILHEPLGLIMKKHGFSSVVV